MEFPRFSAKFKADPGARGPAPQCDVVPMLAQYGIACPSYVQFMRTTIRSSFNGGLLRFLLPETKVSLADWNGPDGWSHDWPGRRGQLFVFAYDWMGRQFAFDNERKNDRGEAEIGMLEPGTGELLQIPAVFHVFIEKVLIDQARAALAERFYDEWRKKIKKQLRHHECAGYAVPLFLNGEDNVENLEIVDVQIYLSLMGQMSSQI